MLCCSSSQSAVGSIHASLECPHSCFVQEKFDERWQVLLLPKLAEEETHMRNDAIAVRKQRLDHAQVPTLVFSAEADQTVSPHLLCAAYTASACELNT